MQYTLPIIGSGTEADPYRVPSAVESWQDGGDGTATVTLTDDMALRVRNFAGTAANALNNGSAWSGLKNIKPEDIALTLVKQDLADTVKLTYSQVMNRDGQISTGDVVAHDNATTKGLWRAQTATTAEPAQGHSDWTLVFEVTV